LGQRNDRSGRKGVAGDQHRDDRRDSCRYRLADWGTKRIEGTERELRRFFPIPIRRHDANEWARLRIAAQAEGVAISDNDLWVAATASRREEVLVTCDLDHVRVAAALSGEVLYLASPV
jgi:predicted nucleic acid-binding protein